MAGFRKATKKAKNLVLSLQGASGAGKTYSALNVAKHLCPPGKRIAFVDTENSADLYGDKFDFDVDPDFGPFGKLNYGPDEWMKKLNAAAAEKLPDGSCAYGVVVLDSLTHMWKGAGGILAQLDADAASYKAKTGKFADTNALWKKFDPMYTKFMNDLRHLPFHVIFCLRAKQKIERKTNDKGKVEMTKLGLEPEFRDGFDYDVDAQFLIDEDHICVAKKHRLGDHLNGKVFENPGKNLADVLLDWLVNGVEEAPATPAPLAKTTAPAVTTEDTIAAAKAMASNDVEEEEAPATNRNPPTEPAIPAAAPSAPAVEQSPTEALLAKIVGAANEAELKAVATEIKAALKDKKITAEDYNGVLSPAYAKRGKELKGQVAA